MRYQQIISLLILIPSWSFAANPKVASELMKDSQKARTEIVTPEENLKKLKAFEKTVNDTIKAYEKASPEKGGSDEEKVVKFSYRFEPLFALAKQKTINKDGCDKAKHQVEFEDLMGKPEDTKLSEAAEESLKWLEILCK